MRAMKRLLAGLAAALATTAAAHAGGDEYRISATLSNEGRVIAAPVMSVRGHERATIEVAGADAHMFALTVTGVDAETVQVEAEVESAHGSMQPTMLVRLGEPASVTVGKLALELRVMRNL